MSLIEELQVKEIKIEDPYEPEKFDAVNLDFYINDTLFGEASISGINTNDAFLYDVGVFPWFRGKGYANQMINYILDHYPVTNLTVKLDNIPAINLYKKHGFKIDRSFDDNGHEMFVMLKESITEDKDFIPSNVKKDTCVAVAYSMLTGSDYDDALKMFPNGRYTTISKELSLIEPKEKTLDKFLNSHKHGKYLVCIKDSKHSDGHAIALINGIAYNTQDYTRNAEVMYYSDLSKTGKSINNDTSYLDEYEKHKSIKDNKYINYAYQKIIEKFGEKLIKNNKLSARVITKGTDGFQIKVNSKSFDFQFSFNCKDSEIYKIIDNIVEKTIV